MPRTNLMWNKIFWFHMQNKLYAWIRPVLDDYVNKVLSKKMTGSVQYWMLIAWYKFNPELMTRNIQKWMIMIVYKFHPGTDKKHPIIEKKKLQHPILDDYRWHQPLYREHWKRSINVTCSLSFCLQMSEPITHIDTSLPWWYENA